MSSLLAYSSRRRKITASLLAPVAAISFLVATDTAPAQAASPTCVVYNYYGQGASRTGNYGTARPTGDSPTSEAVWSIDYNNQNNALEVGFFVGYGNGNLSGGANHTNGQVPYYTLNDGNQEADYWGDFLPRDTNISMFAQALSSTSYAGVGGLIDVNTGYVVDQPRWGFTQGETNETTATMGGGSGGDASTVYWLNSAGSWEPWAYINTCADSPYWASSNNGTDDFENGGPD